MSVEPILVLIVVAVVANLVVMAALLGSPVLGRSAHGRRQDDARRSSARRRRWPRRPWSVARTRTAAGWSVATQTYDRVVRIVSWVFLLATTTIVAVTGLWPANQPAILVLLALTGAFVLVVHDLLPADALGAAKFARRGLGRHHRGDAARRPDRRRARARSSSPTR